MRVSPVSPTTPAGTPPGSGLCLKCTSDSPDNKYPYLTPLRMAIFHGHATCLMSVLSDDSKNDPKVPYYMLMQYCIDRHSADCAKVLLSLLTPEDIDKCDAVYGYYQLTDEYLEDYVCGDRICRKWNIAGVLWKCLHHTMYDPKMAHLLLDTKKFVLSQSGADYIEKFSSVGRNLLKGRQRCSSAAFTLFVVLRKRYRLKHKGFSGGYQLPKDICRTIYAHVWNLRQETGKWVPESLSQPTVVKK